MLCSTKKAGAPLLPRNQTNRPTILRIRNLTIIKNNQINNTMTTSNNTNARTMPNINSDIIITAKAKIQITITLNNTNITKSTKATITLIHIDVVRTKHIPVKTSQNISI